MVLVGQEECFFLFVSLTLNDQYVAVLHVPLYTSKSLFVNLEAGTMAPIPISLEDWN